jgi:hypothetical protein
MVISVYSCLLRKAERTLFAKLQAGGILAALKRDFLPKFGITASFAWKKRDKQYSFRRPDQAVHTSFHSNVAWDVRKRFC